MATVGWSLRTSVPGSTSHALGLFFLAAGIAMIVPAAGAVLGKVVAAMVLGTTSVRFVLTGWYQLSGSSGVKTTAGVVGLILCALATYAALAFLLEDVRRETLLPTLRRGRGKASFNARLVDQLETLASEAGVREQL